MVLIRGILGGFGIFGLGIPFFILANLAAAAPIVPPERAPITAPFPPPTNPPIPAPNPPPANAAPAANHHQPHHPQPHHQPHHGQHPQQPIVRGHIVAPAAPHRR